MKTTLKLGNKVYSENFIRRKLIDFATFLLSLFFLNIIYIYNQVSDSLDVTIIYYISFVILFPIIVVFTVWDFATTKVVIYENGIYSNYSLKYRGTWYFKDIEDILIKPFPYGKNMKQVAILLKNGEEKTVIAYDRENVINSFYENAMKALEEYRNIVKKGN